MFDIDSRIKETNTEKLLKLLNDKTACINLIQKMIIEMGASEETSAKSREYLENMSDDKLQQLFIELYMGSISMSKEDIVKAKNQRVRNPKINMKESALGKELTDKCSDEEKEYLKKRISQSAVSDKIKLTYEEDRMLWNMVKEKDVNNVPSDIFFANTIPLKDVEIVCDETGYIENGTTCNFRVIIFEDEVANLKNKDLLDITCVGIMILGHPFRCTLYVPLLVENGFDFVGSAIYWWENPKMDGGLTKYTLSQSLVEYLSTWYAVQIALLHPRIKEVFENPLKVPLRENKNKNKTRKRKIEYLKVHTIKAKDIEKRIFDDHKKINRKCLCWYVIGHWREYKNGKKVFIQGFWKGALRETKKNYDEGRERIIADNV